MTLESDRLTRNPFPGLRPFATEEANLFFGRQQQIEDLVTRLSETSLVAVTGTSGCGKSSLVLAGLLNELAVRWSAGTGIEWRPVVFRPGNRPIGNLAKKLARALHPSETDWNDRVDPLYGMLKLGGLGLVNAVQVAQLQPQARVVVVVDQFEELFRMNRMTDPEEAAAFVKLLLNAANDGGSPVSVVLTLRSNELGHCADFRDLPEAINRGQFLVPKLKREQRKEAIVKPVELLGFQIAPRLVQRVLNDVSDSFDDLPIMQHALTRTWQYWAAKCQGSRPIDLEDYEAIGTTAKALSNHADEAYNSLPKLVGVTEKVFRALTVAEGVENRRPLDFERLCRVVGANSADVALVVDRFRRPDTAFLVPPLGTELSSNPVIDITHESLIRQWQKLRDWAHSEAESKSRFLRLLEAAHLFERREGDLFERREGDLLGKQALRQAKEWREKTAPTEAWVGLQTREDEKASWTLVKQFLKRSERKLRRRKLITIALVLGMISAGALFTNREVGRQGKADALATRALLEMDQDPARGARLALRALDLNPRIPSARRALRQSLVALEAAHAEHIEDLGKPVSAIRQAADGTLVAVAAGKEVVVFETANWSRQGSAYTRDESVSDVWFVDQNRALVTQTEDGHAQVQRIGDTVVRGLHCEDRSDLIRSLWTHEAQVAVACVNGEVSLWDVSQSDVRRIQLLIASGAVTTTAGAFSADGNHIATADAAGNLLVWKLGKGGQWKGKSRREHKAAVREVRFHPRDPSWLVTSGDDNQAIVWRHDLTSEALTVSARLEHPRPVHYATFTGFGNEASSAKETPDVATVADKAIRMWRHGRQAKRSGDHNDWVNDLSLSEDGEWLVTASEDGTARVWPAGSGASFTVLRGHRDAIKRAIFLNQGGQIMTGSKDGTFRVWRVAPPRILAMELGWILSAAAEPNGTRVAVGVESGVVRIVDLEKPEGPMVRLPRPQMDPSDPLRQRTDMVTDLSWERHRRLLAGQRARYDIYQSGDLVLWDTIKQEEVRPKWPSGMKMFSAVFAAEKNELLTVELGTGAVAVWDSNTLLDDSTPTLIERFAESEGALSGALSPDGNWMATYQSGHLGPAVRLWNRRHRGIGPRILEGHKGQVTAVQFSPDSQTLLTASADRTARIWSLDARSAQAIELKGGHTAGLTSAAFSPDGRLVATGSRDRSVRIWDAHNGEELALLLKHSETVNDVRFTPHGVLSASDDGTVQLRQCKEACDPSLPLQELRTRALQLANLPQSELADLDGN
jgi:WD40 repeat protein/energy-coupling factor transporter ATP-binding protein EcfA2